MVPMSPKCRSDQIQIVSSGPSQTIGLQSRACRISARACRSCMDGVSSIDVTPPVGAAAAAPRRTASAAAPRLPRVPSLRSQRSPGPFPVSALPYSALPLCNAVRSRRTACRGTARCPRSSRRRRRQPESRPSVDRHMSIVHAMAPSCSPPSTTTTRSRSPLASGRRRQNRTG